MRLITAALALCLVGCTPRGPQVPAPTDDSVTGFGSCVLLFQVVDVVAHPDTGTPIVKDTNAPLTWPKGFTAWRVGSEVEVLDADGSAVLKTGGRYWMCPAEYLNGWVVGGIRSCSDCELGGGVSLARPGSAPRPG